MLMYVPADLPEMPPIDESVLSSSDYGPPLPEGHQPWTMKKLTPSADDETGTNTYIMNYTTGIHGVEEDPGRSILFLQFNINTIKHKKIVKNSVTKYNDYAVRFNMNKNTVKYRINSITNN